MGLGLPPWPNVKPANTGFFFSSDTAITLDTEYYLTVELVAQNKSLKGWIRCKSIKFNMFISLINQWSIPLAVWRVFRSEALDGCICFTRKIQHGGDWERCRPQGPKNVHNFLITVRPLSCACGHGTEMLLILQLITDFFALITPRYFPIWQAKEMSHNFVRCQSVAQAVFW